MNDNHNPFAAKLPLRQSRQARADDPVGVLEQLAQALDSSLKPNGAAYVVAGLTANIGVQHRLIVSLDNLHFQDALMEAYIPLDGYPVSLNFYGKEPWTTVDEVDALRTVLSAWLEQPSTRAKLQQLIDLAA